MCLWWFFIRAIGKDYEKVTNGKEKRVNEKRKENALIEKERKKLRMVRKRGKESKIQRKKETNNHQTNKQK